MCGPRSGFFFSYFTLLFGVAASALGVFLLIKPDTVVSVLPILIGLFIVFDGVVRLQSAFDLKRAGFTAWWSFCCWRCSRRRWGC